MEFSLDFRLDGFSLNVEQIADRMSLYRFDLSSATKGDDSEVGLPPKNEYRYGEWIESPMYKFRVVRESGLTDFIESQTAATSSFKFNSFQSTASWAIQNLSLERNEKRQSSLLTITLAGSQKQKLVDFINASIFELQSYELRQKNLMVVNTIEFIDSQIGEIEDKLKNSEAILEQFRADNLIVDLSSESEQMLEYFIELERERNSLNLQKSFYRYVLDFLEREQIYSGLSLPTTSAFNDPLVAQLVQKLVETSVDLERLSYSLDATNPATIELERELRFTKRALYNATENALESNSLVLSDVDRRIAEAENKISGLPATEQKLLGIQRQYDIVGSQFELLLQKRAEAGILQAANLPDTQVIDPAVDRGQKPWAQTEG